MSLKASRTLSKMDDISGVFAGDDDDCGCSWLGLVSLMTFWMVCICSEEALFKIWLKSVEFEGIKNPLKDGWHFWSFCWSWWWLWMFLTGAGVLDDVMDGLHMLWVSYVRNLVEIRWVCRHQEPPQRSMTFLEFLLELMMILMFLTGAGVLDDIMDGLQMLWGSYV